MDILKLIKIGMASWYTAYAVTNTSGPFGWFDKIREWKNGIWHGRHGDPMSARWIENDVVHETPPQYPENGLLDCIICLMPWIALVLWLAPDGIVIWTLATAGLALMLHSYTGWKFQ